MLYYNALYYRKIITSEHIKKNAAANYTYINTYHFQVFDAISYCKGSAVVNMVCAVLGKEKFREGLQLYMKKHAYGSSETIDLWNAWSEVEKVEIVENVYVCYVLNYRM